MSTLKNDTTLEYMARSIRIGTLKTSPSYKYRMKNEKGKEGLIKVKMDMKGIRFTVLPDGGNKNNGDINIKIPRRRLRKVSFHPGRPCPTLWVVTDESFAEKIRTAFKMKSDGPNYDPKSSELAEQEISFISAIDSIPYTVVHSINKLFEKMSDDLDLNGNLFQEITNAQNNEKLVRSAKILSKLDEGKKKQNLLPNNFKLKTSTKRKAARHLSESDTDDEIEIEQASERVLRSKKAKTNDNTKCDEKTDEVKSNPDALERDRGYCKELLTKLKSFTPEKSARSKALITQLISQIEYDQVINIE